MRACGFWESRGFRKRVFVAGRFFHGHGEGANYSVFINYLYFIGTGTLAVLWRQLSRAMAQGSKPWEITWGGGTGLVTPRSVV